MSKLRIEVVGCEHYVDAFRAVCKPNQKYFGDSVSKREYEFYPYTGEAELRREPKNEHDPNAVMVLVGGQKIGYIPAYDAPRIGKLVKSGQISHCEIALRGGDFKEPRPDSAGKMFIAPDSIPLSAKLTIVVKERSRAVLLLLCVFGGFLGLHRFYRREIVWGIVYLLTGGLVLVGWLYDIFRIVTGKMR